jgi:hypothetical protein
VQEGCWRRCEREDKGEKVDGREMVNGEVAAVEMVDNSVSSGAFPIVGGVLSIQWEGWRGPAAGQFKVNALLQPEASTRHPYRHPASHEMLASVRLSPSSRTSFAPKWTDFGLTVRAGPKLWRPD